MLVGVLGVAAFDSLETVQASQVATTSRLSALSQAQSGLDTLTRQLRDAESPRCGTSPVVQAGAQWITFYSNLRGAPSAGCEAAILPTEVIVRLASVDGTEQLEEGLVPPGPGGTYSGAPAWQPLASGVSASAPVFSFLAPGSTTPMSLPATAPSVGAVVVTLEARHTRSGPPVSLTTTITLRNALLGAQPASPAAGG